MSHGGGARVSMIGPIYPRSHATSGVDRHAAIATGYDGRMALNHNANDFEPQANDPVGQMPCKAYDNSRPALTWLSLIVQTPWWHEQSL
jgi:hypothetical protein